MSRSTFKIWRALSTRWHWKLVSPNGKNICAGQPRGYITKQSALKGIKAVKKTAILAKTHTIVDGERQ